MNVHSILRALVTSLLVASSVRAGVVIVDGPSAGIYPDLQSAINAAVDGDTLLVQPGTYASFTIDDKSLGVFATSASTVKVQGSVAVRNLAASRSVVLVGVHTTGQGGVPGSAGLELTNNAGHVRLQSCEFRGLPRPTFGCSAPIGGAGATVENSARVAFVACTFQGAACANLCSGCYLSDGGNGANGLTCNGSSVALYDCLATGGLGGGGTYGGGFGGAGATAAGGVFFASGCTFQGADGGNGCGSPGWNGGGGGNGLATGSTTSVWLVDNVYLRGDGGYGGIYHGDPGNALLAPGAVQLAGVARRISSAASIAAKNSSLAVTVVGAPGDAAFAFVGDALSWSLAPGSSGVWLVPSYAKRRVQFLGTIPASGTLSATLLIDGSGVGADRVTPVQLVVVDGAGQRVLGGPLHVVALDPAATPDCDANGVFDWLEVATGAAGNCDNDWLVDTCEIASGTALDCNLNGVPDPCDLASGTSFDINNNAVPDECETFGATRYVDAAAAPGGNGSSAAPFQNVRDAITASTGGDTIVLADGVYVGTKNRGLDFAGRELIVRSANGAANCTLDCQGLDRAFYLHAGELWSRIEGLTITSGAASFGGAIRVESANATISDCVIRNCNGGGSGGALYVYASAAIVRACTFVGNSAVSGGALTLYHTTDVAPPVISHCQFLDNSASNVGGALLAIVYNGPTHRALIDDCLFAGNTAGSSGGAICTDPGYYGGGSLRITSSTFTANSAQSGGALAVRQDVELANCVLWANSANYGPELTLLPNSLSELVSVSYCDVQGGQGAVYVAGGTLTWGAGNLDLDPRFVDPDGPDDVASTFEDNGYRLRPTSPCIDAGDNSKIPPDLADVDHDNDRGEETPLDLRLQPRRADLPLVPDTGAGATPLVDLGCYERQP